MILTNKNIETDIRNFPDSPLVQNMWIAQVRRYDREPKDPVEIMEVDAIYLDAEYLDDERGDYKGIIFHTVACEKTNTFNLENPLKPQKQWRTIIMSEGEDAVFVTDSREKIYEEIQNYNIMQEKRKTTAKESFSCLYELYKKGYIDRCLVDELICKNHKFLDMLTWLSQFCKSKEEEAIKETAIAAFRTGKISLVLGEETTTVPLSKVTSFCSTTDAFGNKCLKLIMDNNECFSVSCKNAVAYRTLKLLFAPCGINDSYYSTCKLS